ncbi:BACON domain-containing protein [Streptomyces anulatus]|uniref:BACON domain-containing protein n=1 Tax=Streptomyces anulatus TaxID=1892 RepID=UPI003863C599
MTSSRLETPTHTTGAHRAHRRAPHAPAQRPPVRYEPYLDGLFTYCLSVLCDHEAATEALGAVLSIADRQDARGPTAEEERKSWLYALARWVCLRTLTERGRGRQAHRRSSGTVKPPRTAKASETRKGSKASAPSRHQGVHTARRTPEHTTPATPEDAATPAPSESPAAEARRRELATLAWPEAAGTTPEQREALELAVRHRLAPRSVAVVLGLEPTTARELLAGAACEVERTRAALAVVETAGCPTVARLTGDHQVLLSAALRRELVRHVDDCPRCRRAAERADAAGPWPGAALAPVVALPVVEAPRPSVYVAMAQAQRSRAAGPRFDRAGYPLDPKDQAARRDRLRARVVTTTVVATVVAAPVIALWAAYRGAPQTGEGHDGTSVTATEVDGAGGMSGAPSDGTGDDRPGNRFGARVPDVTAEVVSTGGAQHGDARLAVTARTSGAVTTLTLTASGRGPVSWSAATDAPWLRLSRTSGTLAAGQSTMIAVSVVRVAQPGGPWRARISLTPSGSAVLIDGHGGTSPTTGGPRPTRPGTGSPRPTDPGPTDPGPTDPGPTDPGPTDPGPGPTDPTGPPDPTDPPDPTGPPDPTDPPEPTPGPTDPSPTDPAPTDPGPSAPDPTG